MPVKMTSTKDVVDNGVNFCIYGEAGAGKTVLCSTAPKPLIISAEGGLLSLAEHDIPVFEISKREDINEIYDWLTMSAEAANFETVCIDSLSEIAEVLLGDEKALTKDARQAYGVMADEMAISIRAFRDLTAKHVYFSCKLKKLVDDKSGVVSYIPSVPGQTLLQGLPHFFDELFALKLGKTEEGTLYRYLQTGKDLSWSAKDRSDKLDFMEPPDLTHIINKIKAAKQQPTTGV